MTEPFIATPPRRQILFTLVATLIGAALILVVVVLPAEYAIDPTGLGGAIGLMSMHGKGAVVVEDLPAAQAGVATAYDEHYRTEVVTIELAAREQLEYKIRMGQGGAVLYAWETDGAELYSDFHAEPFNDLEDKEVRYEEKNGVSRGYGSLKAPFAGLHGWYWRNDNDVPVKITLEVSGYFMGFTELGRGPI